MSGALVREADCDAPWKSQATRVLEAAAREAAGIEGAATACLLRFDSERAQLSAFNLGDSGFLLFAPPPPSAVATRRRVAYRSSSQLHRDGSPFQLVGGAKSDLSDSPSSALASTHPLQPGMVALIHSDGLLDNLDVDEVSGIVGGEGFRGAGALARRLATAASERRRRPDDVTVIAISVAAPTARRGAVRMSLPMGPSMDPPSSTRRVTMVLSSAWLLHAAMAESSRGSADASEAMVAPAAPGGGGAGAGASDTLVRVESAAELPVEELLKIYGRLASRQCFGKEAPPGASCQLALTELTQRLGLAPPPSDTSAAPGSGGALGAAESTTSGMLSEAAFAELLGVAPFRWPLKPWGTANSESNAKTAVMNKSAETALFMAALAQRGLYDPRNPAGPLPTSLRPALNTALQAEGVDAAAAHIVYRALAGGAPGGEGGASLTAQRLERTYREATGGQPLDYYSFQALVGHQARIVWPVPVPP